MTFKKALTAAVAALTLAGASVTTTSQAQAGSLGGFVAAAVVGGVIGGALAARADAQPAYQPVYRPVQQPVATPVSVCPYGTHLGPQGHYCWAN